jgi:AraC-like DNA-binding protein
MSAKALLSFYCLQAPPLESPFMFVFRSNDFNFSGISRKPRAAYQLQNFSDGLRQQAALIVSSVTRRPAIFFVAATVMLITSTARAQQSNGLTFYHLAGPTTGDSNGNQLSGIKGGPQTDGNVVAFENGSVATACDSAASLFDTPSAVSVLYPAIMREISYWLLSGPHGGEVARMTLCNNHEHRILQAIHFLRDRFVKPVRIGDLAAIAQLSPSAFHRQFKAVTSMTPLQYQKQLRLLEARRLMTSDAANVEKAAFRVGYESASQFSREYGRMFGVSPRRDVNLLKRAAA